MKTHKNPKNSRNSKEVDDSPHNSKESHHTLFLVASDESIASEKRFPEAKKDIERPSRLRAGADAESKKEEAGKSPIKKARRDSSSKGQMVSSIIWF